MIAGSTLNRKPLRLNLPNKSLKPTATPVTPFAGKANPAPRYGCLVPPFYELVDDIKERQYTSGFDGKDHIPNGPKIHSS